MDDPFFTPAPTMGKVAVGGRWEQALVFRPSQLSTKQLEDQLGASEEVACEAFFGSAFFGMRVHGPDPARFVKAFADAMGGAADGPEFFTAVEGLGAALETGFGFAEVGAEGAWNTVGPFRIERPCDVDFEVLWRDLTTSPVGRDRTHDKAVEFTFSGGITHWFALPVSTEGVLVRDKLEAALRTFCA